MFQKDGSSLATAASRENEPVDRSNYVLDPKKRYVSVRFQKKVRARDIESYAASLRANPLFDPDFSEVVDLSEVEELDLNAEEFIRLADEVDPFSLQAKRAFVVRNEIQHHAARMHKILRTQRNFSIFQSLEDARQWLRV
jgi:hypothetical protein